MASPGPSPATRLFLDLDGVLADFDGWHETLFGERPDRANERPDFWTRIDATFFRDMPPMSDALDLWHGARWLFPSVAILTGLPRLPGVDAVKVAWVRKHIDPDVEVICCASRDKRLYGKPGDILVDDWPKYRPLWEEMGGTFVLHTSAESSLAALQRLALPAPARPTAEQIALRVDELIGTAIEWARGAATAAELTQAKAALLTAVTGKDTNGN